MARTDAPVQAFAALKAARPPATARGQERQAIIQAEIDKARDRRERVFKHEWAKKRLCSILRLVRADQWTGYVPPRMQPQPARAGQEWKRNDALERHSLIDLLNDVQRFEETGELPDYATEDE
jgi:hypothetical protein